MEACWNWNLESREATELESLADYDYELPPERIAQVPLEDRSASRLLWLHRQTGQVEHRQFREVTQILQKGDLLVLNDTRVSAVRLMGRKLTGAVVEALLLREFGPGLYEALLKPGRRLPAGTPIEFGEGLRAQVVAELGEGVRTLQFEAHPNLREALEAAGTVPLPPYIHEQLPERARYDTVYATQPGSSAAPTAGLHFTPAILQTLQEQGVEVATVTLHIGLDTFRPIQADKPCDHVMHGETCRVPPETAEKVARCSGRIIAVGTTAVRTLETFAVGPRVVKSGERISKLYITPGYTFRVVDGMFTNFHLPRTTMLLMVSALSSRENLLAAYQVAVQDKYRFLSFGDAMLVV